MTRHSRSAPAVRLGLPLLFLAVFGFIATNYPSAAGNSNVGVVNAGDAGVGHKPAATDEHHAVNQGASERPTPPQSQQKKRDQSRLSSADGTIPPLMIGGKDRASSSPLVTGDGFRAACKWHFDDAAFQTMGLPAKGWTVKGSREKLQKHFAQMRAHDTVFVQTHELNKFLEAVQDTSIVKDPSTQLPIRLVTHNSDYSAPWEPSNVRGKLGTTAYSAHTKQLLESDKIATVWFAQNVIIEHPKLVPIPIGIENRYNKYGANFDVYLSAAANSQPMWAREKTLMMGFSMKTNPKERNSAVRSIDKNFKDATAGAVTKFTASSAALRNKNQKRPVLQEYTAALSQHRFVLAPHGHGVDTHRLWEAMYMGCTPITLRSAMDKKLLSRLPVMLVDSYEEVTPSALEAFALKLKESCGSGSGAHNGMCLSEGLAAHSPLSMEYWISAVREEQAGSAE